MSSKWPFFWTKPLMQIKQNMTKKQTSRRTIRGCLVNWRSNGVVHWAIAAP
jgi:hypothetical protein